MSESDRVSLTIQQIRGRITRLLGDHGLPADATDFGGDHLLECAVTELRWCLRNMSDVQAAASDEEAEPKRANLK